ncbi:LON peptidase substrate-binding domain-containing protein [Botrimarina hoheduenensis]|uniref:Lon protease 2 n=1 Tax=Botrimarina hoheduenensis TaxID=2528000 RepID=A0A5C5WCP6_9BACT|nr:LON peptidase substrate-binding domain-containing protein [Botrimarina hoheduenensis]TWT48698.1 Lon protease 2 [Botrimarina hoheduenensis]
MSSESFAGDRSAGDFDESQFGGVARLFPLPGVSLFPRLVQPLHVFEERYRALMEDALADDGLIAMAVLKPGWEPDYPSRPALEPVACLGKIVAHHRLEDGRFNLLLAGVRRVRIEQEIEPPQAFRRANVTLLHEREPHDDKAQIEAVRQRIATAFRRALPSEPPVQLQEILTSEAPLSLLTDLAAFTLPLPDKIKRRLLAEIDVTARAEILLETLDSSADEATEADGLSGTGWGYPPSFSDN